MRRHYLDLAMLALAVSVCAKPFAWFVAPFVVFRLIASDSGYWRYLADGLSYDQIVDVPSAQQEDLLRVAPGLPDESYLVQKIRGDSGITGAQMPRNGPPFLSDEQINTIIAWVEAGAPPPQAVDPDSEFTAELEDFLGYSTWQAVDYSIGMTNPALAGLHGSDGQLLSRRVFANSTALGASGSEFPNGSILVKEVASFDTGEKVFAEEGGLLAMVKRGGDFNPEHGGWEWFMLAPDLSDIAGRGANLMDGGCNQCHQQAELDGGDRLGGMDYVFIHQSEYVADSSSFSNYQTWDVIDERNDPNPLLDGMAHGGKGLSAMNWKIPAHLISVTALSILGLP